MRVSLFYLVFVIEVGSGGGVGVGGAGDYSVYIIYYTVNYMFRVDYSVNVFKYFDFVGKVSYCC